jgi:exodeoxyribonuclease-3
MPPVFARDGPVVLAGDYNVIPTAIDVYKPERWVDDALFRIETCEAFERLSAKDGPMPFGICIPT